ncbi:MAG: hypothetical protein A3D52_01505 [Candidatus Taylorbacteria bacterium RIFCSPHIGHO2_02_FULL_44_36]|uniref:Uncharacterized protein n=1 Tax=Candidatus Taylorbacteria bacterium RIFCSPLOWO2_12_FULL_44_15c TaxID=1802333 RepID=A0A1G2P7E6_9BACT|nr:MAG: hypothetical protein A3D52_01505 [Candidatus Taylorbacteria bacterium RIFCSPHIGHO2_02_FULL_44_36]OHA39080.1 MAG: hypothetical protein A3I97_00325 [Candidatus Taylorbacteria bacterium RIFCSPLOWO2_02_FULL_44_35]OHA44257.1 MAG: hypothetical protein A3G03_02900 [Candidatus Taylorbacteria bacterium RIFCSPLOWO2_12_FULL_44_15c]
MIIRGGIGLAFCVASLILPWWLFLLIGISMAFVYRNFYELLFMAIFLDLLYGAPSGKFLGFRFALTLLAAIILVITTILKRRLKNYLNV